MAESRASVRARQGPRRPSVPAPPRPRPAGASAAVGAGPAEVGAADGGAADGAADAAVGVGAGAAAAAGAGAGRVVGGAWGGREAAGAAGADWAGLAAAGAGVGVGRLLLIRRDERAGASDAAAGASDAAAGADTGRAGAFLTGALLAAELLDTDVSGRLAGASPPALSSPPPTGAADLAALVALPAFLAGAGSSGWTGRRRPSASALRRTRSAWASSMEEEWLLTPIPRERASSSPSLLVRPSSLASS